MRLPAEIAKRLPDGFVDSVNRLEWIEGRLVVLETHKSVVELRALEEERTALRETLDELLPEVQP